MGQFNSLKLVFRFCRRPFHSSKLMQMCLSIGSSSEPETSNACSLTRKSELNLFLKFCTPGSYNYECTYRAQSCLLLLCLRRHSLDECNVKDTALQVFSLRLKMSRVIVNTNSILNSRESLAYL